MIGFMHQQLLGLGRPSYILEIFCKNAISLDSYLEISDSVIIFENNSERAISVQNKISQYDGVQLFKLEKTSEGSEANLEKLETLMRGIFNNKGNAVLRLGTISDEISFLNDLGIDRVQSEFNHIFLHLEAEAAGPVESPLLEHLMKFDYQIAARDKSTQGEFAEFHLVRGARARALRELWAEVLRRREEADRVSILEKDIQCAKSKLKNMEAKNLILEDDLSDLRSKYGNLVRKLDEKDKINKSIEVDLTAAHKLLDEIFLKDMT